MEYLITFLEGLISFISPCMLPLLPLYVSYFAAGAKSKRQAFARALAFVVGFTLIFCLLGLSMGTVGGLSGFVRGHRRAVEIVCGVLIVFFGLTYLEVIPLRFLKGVQKAPTGASIASAFLFGIVFFLFIVLNVADVGRNSLCGSSLGLLLGCLGVRYHSEAAEHQSG